MTTFTDLLADVYTITNRPDLVAETKLAVRQATLRAHQLDFFPKDIFESGLTFPTSDYYQSLDYRSALPTYRAMKYMRKYDAVNLAPGKFLSAITPEQLMDRYNVEQVDIYYQAGSVIQIKTYEQNQYFLFGCYVNPDTTETGYTSWIALDQPTAITIPAAASVFKMIGFDEQAQTFNALSAQEYAILKINQLQVQGY